ncbi:MAG: hypothetical protein WEF86_14965 [Gemmatimonadota bacterium]
MNAFRRAFTFPIPLTPLGFMIMAGCSDAPPGHESLTPWAAITLVDELWEVGRIDGPEYETLGQVGGVTFVGSGLAVSDSHSNRIHWYDSSGQHRVSAGNTGGGPGEFVMVRNLDVLPDGSLAALDDGGGSIEFFSNDGESTGSLRFQGQLEEMCLIDSTIVVLGTLEGSDRPLHLMDLVDGAWRSVGPGVPMTDDPHWRLLARGLSEGTIGCMDERIIYARSSDGTVRALDRDGTALWEVRVPSFVGRVHEYVPGRGVRHAPPEGATELNGFIGVNQFGRTVAVQVYSLDPRIKDLSKDDVSIFTVFLDLDSGQILGRDDSLPQIVASMDDRVAVVWERPQPQIEVHSITVR